MPSTYTPSLRVTLPATGELDGSWGNVVNTQITAMLEQAIAGYVSIAMADANTTLTTANGADDQARNMYIQLTGVLTAGRNIVVPTAEKLYFIKNNTTGGFTLTVKTSAGTGIGVPAGTSALLMCDGTNVIEAATYFASLSANTLQTLSGIGIGTAPAATVALYNGLPMTGATVAYGFRQENTIQSGVTTSAQYNVTTASTAAAAFTVGSVFHYTANQGTIGAGSAVTNQYGFSASLSLTGATNNYGFYGNIATAAGRWNFYAAGTAPNHFTGVTTHGDKFGYQLANSVGGSVTQITNKGTAVTLDTVCGNIITTNAALAADTTVTFTLNNSKIVATDSVIVTHHSGSSHGSYLLSARASAGAAEIAIRNITAGSLSDAIGIKFVVISAPNS
jgi:hypothetical protein